MWTAVDSEETGGLFSKSDSADRYAICLTRLGSVLGRRIKIKWLWLVGRAGRRRDSPATCSRGGGSPDLAKLGRPGVKSTRTWVWGGLRGTCSPPGVFAGLGEDLSGESDGGGGSARWRSPARTRSCRAGVISGRERVRVRAQG